MFGCACHRPTSHALLQCLLLRVVAVDAVACPCVYVCRLLCMLCCDDVVSQFGLGMSFIDVDDQNDGGGGGASGVIISVVVVGQYCCLPYVS